jgi:hypothetical protein
MAYCPEPYGVLTHMLTVWDPAANPVKIPVITLVQKRFEKMIEKLSSSWEIVVAQTAAKSQSKRRTETHGTLCKPI